MKYIALPAAILGFNVLGNETYPHSLVLACIFYFISGLCLGHLACLAYEGSKSDGDA